MECKKQGEIAETILQLELQKKEFIVSRPVGDSDSYDLISDKNGMITRIQIKSTKEKETNGRSNRYRINSTKGSKYKTPYNENEADILCFYIFPLELWYIIPISKLRGLKTVSLYPHKSKDYEFSKYANRWDLLE